MHDAVPPLPPPHPHQTSLFRRRIQNIETTTTASTTSSSSPSESNFELISIKPISYTSLRDLLPSAIFNSPRPMTPHHQVQSPGSEISIRNRLVKQAAWAYLQPMSTSTGSSGHSFLHRLLGGRSPLSVIVGFFDRYIIRALSRAMNWLLRAFRVRSSR